MKLFCPQQPHTLLKSSKGFKLVHRKIICKFEKFPGKRQRSGALPITHSVDDVSQIVQHFDGSTDQLLGTQLIKRHRFESPFCICKGIQPDRNVTKREVWIGSISFTGFHIGHGPSNAAVCVANQYFDCSCTAKQCYAICVRDEMQRMRTLLGHYEYSHAQCGDGPDCLHPSSPVLAREVIANSKDDKRRSYQKQAAEHYVAASHKTLKSFHKGIIA